MAPLNSDAQALTSPNGDAAEVRKRFWALTFGSIGVVYGDIGTSPLYALREAVLAAGGEDGVATHAAVYGVLSLIFWSLIVVVTLKYVLILLRADNNGEGGTLALTALAFRALGRRTPLVLALGIVGASMFYGSTLITPAISVLSAVEGLNVATPRSDHMCCRLRWSFSWCCSRSNRGGRRGSRPCSRRSPRSGSSS
jgi:KUP system potassium uptake protein